MKKFIYPPVWVIIICVPLAAALLTVSFVFCPDSPLAYFSYIFSAYSLTVLVAKVISAVKSVKTRLMSRPLSCRLLSDMQYRTVLSIYAGFTINMLYVLLKAVSAVLYSSLWEAAISAYYLVLGITRFSMIFTLRKETSSENEWISYRRVGMLMLLLNVAMGGIIIQMVIHDKSYNYPGYVIYASAAYTFYLFTISIINIFKFRKLNSPVLSASKALNFAGALMSVISLQTAMITQFGDEVFPRRTANAMTGFSVVIVTLIMAVYMIIRSNRALKGEKSNEK